MFSLGCEEVLRNLDLYTVVLEGVKVVYINQMSCNAKLVHRQRARSSFVKISVRTMLLRDGLK